MKFSSKKTLYRFLILLSCGGVVILLFIFLTSFLENKIESKIISLNGKVSSVHINLLARTLTVENLELFPKDGSPYGLNLKQISITGLNLYQILTSDKIIIHELNVQEGRLIYDKSLKAAGIVRNTFEPQQVFIRNIKLTNILSEVRTDTLVDFSALLNFTVKGFSIKGDSLNEPVYSAVAMDCELKNINISRSSGMYGMSASNFSFKSEDQRIVIDSVLLIPNVSKFEFAHKKGEQVGRVNLSVPQLVIEGISLEDLIDSVYTATKVEITSFDLHSFKDKRVPFRRDYTIPLPMESFLKLPYSITVDSLVIKDSRVTIEEIAETETGARSGIVTFEHINASSGRLTNRKSKKDPAYTVLYTKGLMMGSGLISASFSFPLDGSPTYYTKGSIGEMPFEKLNPLLGNLVRFRIESGTLNSLKFNFQYNDLASTGTMEIDYVDVKLTGLNKDHDKDEIKTLLANTIVKNDKSKSLPIQRRTGVINAERDRRRYIFNIWWKSILSGLKSTVLGIEGKTKTKQKK